MAEPRGIDPKIATGLPPALDATADVKGYYVTCRYAAQNDHYIGFFKTWTKAINFLIGEHWRTKWDGTTFTWHVERDIPPWHQQPVTNYTFAVYRAALSKLTKQKPTLEVVPASGASQDKEAAELSEALLTFLWRYLKKPQKLPLALGWMLVTGMAFFRIGWDPEGGERRPRTIPMQRPRQPLVPKRTPNLQGTQQPELGQGEPNEPSTIPGAETAASDQSERAGGAEDTGDTGDTEDVEVAADEDGEPYKNGQGEVDFDREPDRESIGEICFDVISPLCVRFNPEATSVDDATEMYVATLWPRKRIAKRFGLKEEEIPGGDESTETHALYADLMSSTAAGFPRSWADTGSVWGVSQQNAIGDRALMIEYYHDKCDEYEDGRHWISVNGLQVWPPTSKQQAKKAESAASSTTVDDTDFPNGEAPLPFGFWPPLIPMFDTPIPGQPTALGLLPQVVPLNEQLNVLDGKIAEYHVMEAMGGRTIISPEDRGIVITTEPGQVIISKAFGRRGQGFGPYQPPMHPMPEPVYREREVMTNKIMVVSGLSAVDLSQKPQGVTSGRALLVTQETSDSVFMPTLFAMEAALEECGRRELVIAQEKYREPRMISVKGSDGQWLFRSFINADLRSGHDVRVQVGSSFPWSKAAQWDTKLDVIKTLPQLVIQNGTVNEERLAHILDSGAPGLNAFESDENADLIEIQREHAQFESLDPTAPDGSHQVPQLGFWQNHPVHLAEHQRFMKKSFDRFQRWSPTAQQAFLQHMQLTMVAISEQAEAMLGPGGGAGAPAALNAPPGAGAPPGAEAPPGPQGPPPMAVVRGGAGGGAGGGGSARLGRSDFQDAQRARGA